MIELKHTFILNPTIKTLTAEVFDSALALLLPFCSTPRIVNFAATIIEILTLSSNVLDNMGLIPFTIVRHRQPSWV